MSYEFKTLGSVEALTKVPENANVLVEVDGAIKRAPGGALGGNGGKYDLVITDQTDNSNLVALNIDEGNYQNVYNKIFNEHKVPNVLIKYRHAYGRADAIGVEHPPVVELINYDGEVFISIQYYSTVYLDPLQIRVFPNNNIESNFSIPS